MTTTKNKQLAKYLAKSNYANYTFTEDFNAIIDGEVEGYSGTTKERLESFFNDMQRV